MTKEEIISGLKFTVEMFLFDPSTGETITEPRNDMDETTINACRGAIELLEQEPKQPNEDILYMEYMRGFNKGKAQESALDKIRTELHTTAELHDDGDYYLRDEWIDEIFDKYKAEVATGKRG